MPRGYPPSVFISSTCYDLGQIRLDLKRFVESLGYDGIISESPAFPVDPQVGTFENCVNAVRERADVFVLVVGGRYGSQRPDGKSITNLEYIEARAKKIPIYVFVAKSILHTLPVWKDNPNADFSRTVDTPRLFEFVHELRGAAGHWVYGFDEGAEIITTLRQQWALLFTDALTARNRLKAAQLSPELAALSASALIILIEKPPIWEHRFYSIVLRAELEALAGLRRDLRYELRLKPVVHLTDWIEVKDWILGQLERIRRLIESLMKLGNESLLEALGPSGVPGDPELLLYVARRMGEAVREVLNWTLDFLNVSVPDDLQRLVKLSSEFSKDAIENIFSFPDRMDSMLTEALEALSQGGTFSAKLTLCLDLPSSPELEHEIALLKKRINGG